MYEEEIEVGWKRSCSPPALAKVGADSDDNDDNIPINCQKNRVMPAQWDHIHNSSVSSSLMSVCTVVHFLKDFSCRQRLAIIRQNYKDFSLWVGVAFCWLTAPRWRCHFLLSNHPEPVLKTLVLWEMNRRIWGFFPSSGDTKKSLECVKANSSRNLTDLNWAALEDTAKSPIKITVNLQYFTVK